MQEYFRRWDYALEAELGEGGKGKGRGKGKGEGKGKANEGGGKGNEGAGAGKGEAEVAEEGVGGALAEVEDGDENSFLSLLPL